MTSDSERRADDDALVNILGAVALAITEQLLGPRGLATLAPPLDHATASAALSLVRWMPGTPMPALASYLELSQADTVRLVQRMQAGGYMMTRRERGDRRVRLYPTPSGVAAAEHLDSLRRRAVESVLERLDDAQRRQLLPLVRQLAGGLPRDQAHAMHVCRLCQWETCRGACPVWGAVKPSDT